MDNKDGSLQTRLFKKMPYWLVPMYLINMVLIYIDPYRECLEAS